MPDMPTTRERPPPMAEKPRIRQRIHTKDLHGPDASLFQPETAITRQIEQKMPLTRR